MVKHRTINTDIMDKINEEEKETSYEGQERVSAPPNKNQQKCKKNLKIKFICSMCVVTVSIPFIN